MSLRSVWWHLICERYTLELFNKDIVPLMKTEGPEFLEMAKQEAKRRGYKANKSTGRYEQ